MALKTKLTMISVSFRGLTKVIFVQAYVDENGKTYAPMGLIHDMAAELGCPAGSTYCTG